MMRSLFSGVAGLRTHQTRMDVIGNNIANVNTVAYKSQTATFQDLLYQTTSNASGANNETGRGGVNAKQIGLGASMAAINTNISTQGSSQSTGVSTDIMISGDSFFIVSDGTQNYFTRSGAFYVDGAGNLAMTSNGYVVQGWQPNENTTDDPDDSLVDTVSPLRILAPENQVSEPEQTKNAYVEGVIDKDDPNLTATGRVVNITLFDNLGYSYIAQLSITENAAEGVYSIEATKLIDSEGEDLVANGTATFDINTTTIAFDTKTGKLASADNPFSLTIGGLDGFAEPISIDFSNVTNYGNNGNSTITGHYGDTNGNNTGRKLGAMSGFAIQQDGKIYASYDNGTRKLLGQIAVASFSNPSGLEKMGDNLYQTTQNSGPFDGIGKDITADGSGKMTTGVLEMSNVDLSNEFTEMITTQRGFQANSRIITVSDTMLEELINLKR